MSHGTREAILAVLEEATEPIPSTTLATRIYGSADRADAHALRTAIYTLRRARPDLKIETSAQVRDGHLFGPVTYHLVKSS
jgi:hypothetical protein